MKMYHKLLGIILILGLIPFSLVMAQSDSTDAVEANKEIVRRALEEGFGTGDMDVLNELISPDMVDHELEAMEGLSALETLNLNVAMLNAAISDFEFVIIDMIAEGDKVAVIGAWSGTHTGDDLGIPATGNELYIPVFDLFRIEDGLIIEHWGVTDNLAFMTQFGVIPPMPEMEG